MLRIAALTSALCIVAVWGLYPALIGLMASVRRRIGASPDVVSARQPRVTAVLATRADPTSVRDRVDDLLRSEYPANLLDVVVAYDARATEPPITWSDSVSAARVRVVTGDEPGGKAAALNAGMRAATGDVVVFADSGQRFGTDAIPLLVAAVMGEGVGAASGRLELSRGEHAPSLPLRLYWSLERWLRRREAEVHSTIGVTGAIYAMRRSLWSTLPAGLILDDLYVPMRLVLDGHRVAFVDGARAYETRATTDTNEYRRKVRTLTGVWQLCAWLPETLVPLRNPVWAQFVAHKLLRLLTPYWLLVCVVWMVAAVEQRMGLLWFALASALFAAALQLRSKPFRVLRSALVSSVLIQVATVRATANGARKRWDVWHA
ncbi:MAG: putative glycosyltransferase [Gemmatimonadetes bacterium]|nr:putative glycosyltransferase [Gemmatimonadota bacterium]